ncbi:hypothetical protein G9A89_006022 [Geosiphon pyriformis]|nr:hypothetical protein G9A89_006022 [Geosiphon pyriformis]
MEGGVLYEIEGKAVETRWVTTSKTQVPGRLKYGRRKVPISSAMASATSRNPGGHTNISVAGSSSTAGKKRHAGESVPIIQSVRKKRPGIIDRNIPSGIEGIVPESRLYADLQHFERLLDATIIRKRLENHEAMSTKPMKTKRILRVFISNSAANQHVPDTNEPDLDYQTGNIPSWTLRIEGRLLDPPYAAPKGRSSSRKFSFFLKSVLVELDRDPELFPEGNTMEWTRTSNTQECDGFEIKRKGDQNVKARIFLTLDNRPEKYKLSPAFANLLDIQEETRSGIIRALWQYVKYHKLQDSENQRIINCDAPLQAANKISFPELPELLNPLVDPVDPIQIDYTIRVDKTFHASKYAYDIEVEVDDVMRQRMAIANANTAQNKEVQALDEKIVQCIQSINNSKIKRDFLLQFTQSPVDFIQKWVASQSRDLEVILGESRFNLEEQRQADFYKQPWASGATFQYIAAKARFRLDITQRRMQELLRSGAANNPIV